MTNKTLIAVVGPTAIGKTALGVQLAKRFNTEVISADSRQFYQEMAIGTAKPTLQEMDGIPHHFVDFLSIQQEMSAGEFERQALNKLEEIFKTKDYAILVGGSGLFVNALCFGLDDIPSNLEIRNELTIRLATQGIEPLLKELQQVDPEFYKSGDIQNPIRVIRALEVFQSSGKKFSTLRKNKPKKRPFNIKIIGLNLPRELVYKRINQRVDIMVEMGLLDEVRSLLPYRELPALKTVGYQELFDHLDDPTELKDALEMVKQNTRRFAKRQITWFKKIEGIKWFEPVDYDSILEFIQN